MSRHTDAIRNYKNRLAERLFNVDADLARQLQSLKLDWFTILNQAEDTDTTEVFIYDEIGGSFGVDMTEFVRQIADVKTPRIVVRINSPGGSLFDAIAGYSALVQHPAHVVTRVDSLAASAASIIAMAGDEVEFMDGGQMMIHDVLGVEMGNARDMKAMSTFLDRQSDNIAALYAKRAGGEIKDWRERMLAETWYFASEAIDVGLADRVYTKPSKSGDSEGGSGGNDGNDDGTESTELDVDNVLAEFEALLARPHDLSNKDFKFKGRKQAPNPTLHSDVDDLLSAFDNGKAAQ